MSRTGFYWPDDDSQKEETAQEIKELCNLPGINYEGIFTHFAAADGDENFTNSQIEKFHDARKTLAEKGLAFKISHAAASVSLKLF